MRIVNKKIIFFGDFGIDDAVALIYANKTCKLDILGIVAEYGMYHEISLRKMFIF
ncbi:Inosine-uridine preferring nucleoside hydrolase in exosporium [Bacillus cereus]|nr:Inosine-uridine preferring nucleoside hydrolase in exosporium [Bacillus cereus]